MTDTEKPRYRKTLIQVPDAMHLDARMFALQHGISLAELIRRAVAEYLQAHAQEPAK